MKILHLSDTHGKHKLLKDLPTADVIVHSGDVSFAGSDNEVLDFMEWFIELPYKHKIFIAGNHDDCLYQANINNLPEDCHYLCNSGITIENVFFYGIPMFMQDVVDGSFDKFFNEIPTSINILITHQPPYNILDFAGKTHYGDLILLQKILQIQPKYHLFGHIHDAYGTEKIGSTTFVNASILNEQYELANKPIVLEI
jgi:Icc-related predicted phosphoesterase